MPVKPDPADRLTPSRTIIIGGTSRLGTALRVRMPGTRSISRQPDPGDDLATAVADYHAITPAMLANADCILHLIGTPRGSVAELDDANALLARSVAMAAREAGAARFVHVSSFSVYGAREAIDTTTPAHPDSDYGRSKWRAEQLLAELRSESFAPLSVRLPSLYGPADGKLHRLITAWTKWRIFPKPARRVERSFLSYDQAAQLLLAVAGTDAHGSLAAADPCPFTFDEARRMIETASGRRIRLAPIPLADAAIAAIAPGLHASVFKSSLLAPEANAARDFTSTLYGDIAAMARQAADRA